jgi:flagellar biogenesis protein FliO
MKPRMAPVIVLFACLAAGGIAAAHSEDSAATSLGAVPRLSSDRGATGLLDPSWDAVQADLSEPASIGPHAEQAAGTPLRRSSGGRPSAASGGSPRDSSPVWLQTLVPLGAVVGLFLLLAWGYRAVTGAGRARIGHGLQSAAIEVLGRVGLTARHSLCLVRIGPKLVLVGVGGDRLTMLDVLNDAEAVAAVAGRAAQRSPGPEFQRCLEREAREYLVGEGPGDEVGPGPAASEHGEERQGRAGDSLSRAARRMRTTLERIG